MEVINERHDQNFTEYGSLYQWSIENIPDFWASMWDFAGIKASRPFRQVIDDVTKMPGAKWFSGARLNFAENLLRYGIVKYLAHKIKINSIARVGKKIIFKFYPSSSANLARMTKLMERSSGSITPQGVMTLSLQAENETEIMIATISFLKELSSYNIINVDSS